MRKNNINKGEIAIYKPKGGEIELKVKLEKETVWLMQSQIALLFDTKRPAITKHLNNIFKSKELDKNSVCSILEHTAADGKTYKTQFYNLDAIISVGYRVNSKRATQFRIWATNVLKQHILQGYTINQKRLLETREKFRELQNAIAFLQEKTQKKLLEGQEKEILNLLSNYAKTLTLLGQYDKGKIEKPKGKKAKFVLKYEECQQIVKEIKKELIAKKEAGDIFGRETRGAFEGIIKGLYQTFNRKELYPTVEDKASHLLYFTIKDHPFIDGNKRIGSFLFVYFLDKNDYLYRKNGEKKINNNALVSLALLIAESNPKEKDILIKIITNLISA
ncbi:virulence protein RhuM/Fic/DOC family protein [candidate division WOR-3 bacterium]|nr:virulence protein RhuM/Fic/DOC family protein [candidate division WOR-3 bacterium]